MKKKRMDAIWYCVGSWIERDGKKVWLTTQMCTSRSVAEAMANDDGYGGEVVRRAEVYFVDL